MAPPDPPKLPPPPLRLPRQTSLAEVFAWPDPPADRSGTEARPPPLPPQFHRRLQRVLGDRLPCVGVVHLRCFPCEQGKTLSLRCGPGCPVCRVGKPRPIDRMIPRVPVRHWVLSVPRPIRAALASDAHLAGRVGRAFVSSIFAIQRDLATQTLGWPGPLYCGCVAVTQRAGSALNLDLHFHILVLDGLYTTVPDSPDELEFRPLPEPTEAFVEAVGARTRQAVARIIRRWTPPAVARGLLRSIERAGVAHRVTAGPKVRSAPSNPSPPRPPPPHVESTAGFHISAGHRLERDDRPGLARLCRYLTRPPLDIDALELQPDGRIRYQLAHPLSDGTTVVEFSRQEFAQRLAALVPGGPVRRVAYHGILAPAAAKRWAVIRTAQQLPLGGIESVAAKGDKQPAAANTRPVKSTGEVANVDPLAAARCGECKAEMTIVGVEDASDGIS